MSDPRRPSLFDLLSEESENEPGEAQAGSETHSTSEPGATDTGLPLFPPDEIPDPELRTPSRSPSERSETGWPPERPGTRTERPARSGPVPASLGSRYLAGALDLGLHVGLGGILLGGAWLLGARPWSLESLGIPAFLVVFSFLYTTIPLAFWGQTPGMMQARIAACNEEEGALTFGQTALRWLGSLLTLGFLGLPALLALVGGRSFSDRLSGSRSWRA